MLTLRTRAVQIVAALLVGGVLPFLAGTQASFAHVHGITPLSQCTVDNPNSGGLGTDGTPADDANGGPIVGLIPRDTGNAPLAPGDGGRTAPVECP